MKKRFNSLAMCAAMIGTMIMPVSAQENHSYVTAGVTMNEVDGSEYKSKLEEIANQIVKDGTKTSDGMYTVKQSMGENATIVVSYDPKENEMWIASLIHNSESAVTTTTFHYDIKSYDTSKTLIRMESLDGDYEFYTFFDTFWVREKDKFEFQEMETDELMDDEANETLTDCLHLTITAYEAFMDTFYDAKMEELGFVYYHVKESPLRKSDYLTMHRMYNPNSGEHFYTAKEAEKNALVKIGWKYEGVGWYSPKVSYDPVYRLYNSNSGDHHYTMKAKERDALVKMGWTYEGVGWCSEDLTFRIPTYREYNPHAHACNHNYTTNWREHDALVEKLGWNDEGIAWYGVDIKGEYGEGNEYKLKTYKYEKLTLNVPEWYDVEEYEAEGRVLCLYLNGWIDFRAGYRDKSTFGEIGLSTKATTKQYVDNFCKRNSIKPTIVKISNTSYLLQFTDKDTDGKNYVTKYLITEKNGRVWGVETVIYEEDMEHGGDSLTDALLFAATID